MGGKQMGWKQNTIAQSCLSTGSAACNRLVTRNAPTLHCPSSQDVDALPLARREFPAQVATAPIGRACFHWLWLSIWQHVRVCTFFEAPGSMGDPRARLGSKESPPSPCKRKTSTEKSIPAQKKYTGEKKVYRRKKSILFLPAQKKVYRQKKSILFF